ncbi:hypothetical protein, partial [Luteitalea sp.]|uniref:hypothetical protein n=1 Tax=Luteitalea sp. TaxID=2004800 RepID=UPI0025BD59F7
MGRRRAIRDAGIRLDQAAAGDRQPELCPQDARDFAERQPQPGVPRDHERRGSRAEVRRGGAERFGRLQRMPALHALTAPAADADVGVECADDRAGDGHVLLILRGHVRGGDPAATAGARRGQRRRMALVDVARPGAVA